MRQHLLLALGSALLLAPSLSAQNARPLPAVPPFPFNMTGLITAGDYMGSGAVVRHPRVVASCAHVVYDETLGSTAGAWVLQNRFFRAYFSGSYPTTGGTPLRGYMRWGTYASYVTTLGGDSNEAFSTDFVAHFTYSDIVTGPAAPFWADGLPALTSTRLKGITGYPSGLYANPSPNEYRMHTTGGFTQRLTPVLGRYLEATGPSTGSGNSGGPAWVFDSSTNTWRFAGVLVSGDELSTGGSSNMIGVTAADPAAWSLVSSAITAATSAAPAPLRAYAATGLPRAVPDGNTNGVSIPITVSGAAVRIETLLLTLRVNHPYPNDLQVILRSPGGRSVTVTNRPSSEERNLVLTARPIEGFAGLNPNGTWQLIVRDVASGDSGSVAAASLQIGAR